MTPYTPHERDQLLARLGPPAFGSEAEVEAPCRHRRDRSVAVITTIIQRRSI
jgi:hypothetical protein